MIREACNGDVEELKRLKQIGYDFNVVDEVSTTHIMLNYKDLTNNTALKVSTLVCVHDVMLQ